LKKTKFSTLLLSGLLLACAGQANAEGNDASATLSISGTVHSTDFACAVMVNKGQISLIETPDALIKQGDNATHPVQVKVSINGGDECQALVEQGRMAFKVVGVADNAEGTTLANRLSDDSAAKGLGIGIFDEDNKPFNVNTGKITKGETIFGFQVVQLSNQSAVEGNINTVASIQIERL
jgi:type 1 fimbria pilin